MYTSMFLSLSLFGVADLLLVITMTALSHSFYFLHRTLQKVNKSSSNPSRDDAADVARLLQLACSALEQLQSEVSLRSNQFLSWNTDLRDLCFKF